MARYAMVIDLGKCVGCNACAAACMAENLLSPSYYEEPPLLRALDEAAEKHDPVEAKKPIERVWMRTTVHRLYMGKYPNVSLLFVHNLCRHCEDAPCVAVCPTGASYQREDGIVAVDPEKCILCGYCIAACPYAARFVNHYTRTVDKCTFCYHRLAEGRLPACVETCPTGARMFGDLDDPNSEVAKIVNEGRAVPGTPEGPLSNTKPRLFFVLQQPRQ
jgi:tetrathionate reductase subunit B